MSNIVMCHCGNGYYQGDPGESRCPWCESKRLKEERDRVGILLLNLLDVVDDVLFNPDPSVFDSSQQMEGDERYLADVPIMEKHLPALRQMFVRVYERLSKEEELLFDTLEEGLRLQRGSTRSMEP